MGGEEIGEAVWRGLSIVPKASAHVFAVLVKSCIPDLIFPFY